MNKEAIEEYHNIMDEMELIVLAQKSARKDDFNPSLDTIMKRCGLLLNDMRQFCINYVGDLEEF